MKTETSNHPVRKKPDWTRASVVLDEAIEILKNNGYEEGSVLSNFLHVLKTGLIDKRNGNEPGLVAKLRWARLDLERFDEIDREEDNSDCRFQIALKLLRGELSGTIDALERSEQFDDEYFVAAENHLATAESHLIAAAQYLI